MNYLYDVFHKEMRNATIHIGNPGNEEYDENDWRDYQTDPLMDTVFAENEFAAVKKVSEQEALHKDNLYAEKRCLTVRKMNHIREDLYEIFAYCSNDENGLDISMPDGTIRVLPLESLIKVLEGSHHETAEVATAQTPPALHERIYFFIRQIERRMSIEPVLCSEFWKALSSEFSDFQYFMDCGNCQEAIIEAKSVRFYIEYRDTVMESDPYIIHFLSFHIDDVEYPCR